MNPGERYHALDSLRAVMMLLGIYLHVVVGFSRQAGNDWPYLSLVADGVYVRNEVGKLVFRALPGPSRAEVQAVAWRTCERVCGVLRKRGLWLAVDPSEDPRDLFGGDAASWQ
jgi:hypothetical protein